MLKEPVHLQKSCRAESPNLDGRFLGGRGVDSKGKNGAGEGNEFTLSLSHGSAKGGDQDASAFAIRNPALLGSLTS
jgi:hypothetical protein